MTRFIRLLKSIEANLRLNIIRDEEIIKELHSLVQANREFTNTLTQFIGFKAKMEAEEKRERDLEKLEKKASKADWLY